PTKYYQGNNSIVTLSAVNFANSCPSHLDYNGPIVVFNPMAHFLPTILTLKLKYKALRHNYHSLIDGGNTKRLKNKIANSWSSDGWEMRSKLLSKSPYLSASSLLKAAERKVLPNAMLLEVLLANPDATKKGGFIDKLKEKLPSLPNYVSHYVRESWDKKTARTKLEAKMASVQVKLSRNEDNLKYLKIGRAH